MADGSAVAVLARLPPVRSGKDAWLAALRGLVASGAVEEAELVLSTLAQAHDRDVPLRVLLAGLALRTGRWTEALAAARQAVALAESSGAPLARLQAAVALALALGHVARHTPVMAPSERSKCRAEARAALEPFVGVKHKGAFKGGAGGAADAAAARCATANAGADADGAGAADAVLSAFRAESQYYLALLYAEGGHFGASADAARAALAACPAAGAKPAPPQSPLLRPAVLGLLALLLSPHQPRPALQLADAAIACCPATGSGDAAAASDSEADGGGLRVGHARGLDVVLLRTRAALLLAVGETGAALEALALAKQRLSAARRGAGDMRVARQYALMEAQVWRELALAYAGQRQDSDANVCVAQAELIDPNSADTAHVAGVVAEAAGDTAAAAALYEKALALAPAHAPSLRSLGALLSGNGDANDTIVARSLLADALRYDSTSFSGWFTYGGIEAGTEAERHLHHAVTLAAATPIIDCSELPLLL